MRRLAIVLSVLLVASACSGAAAPSTTTAPGTTTTTNGTTTFTSVDGTVVVEVEGTDDTITIDPVDPIAELGLPAELETYGAWELGPDGFDRGAIVTVDTGVAWGDRVPVVVGLLGTDDGGWEMVRTAAVAAVNGEMTVAFDVPHFSPLVIIGTPLALDIDPRSRLASVGERWDAFWDLVDPKAQRIMNGPAMRGFFYDIESGRDLIGTVRPIVDEADVDVTARSDGAVTVVPGESEIGTYAFEPGDGFDLADPDDGPLVEVFYGFDTFTCLAPGEGYYGFTVDLAVPRADLLIGTAVRDRLVLVNPRDGVEIRYDVAGRAICQEHPYVSLSRVLQSYHGFPAQRAVTILGGLVEDTGSGLFSISTVVPGGFRPAVDLWDHHGFRYGEMSRLRLDLDYNRSVFECGTTADVDGLDVAVTTVCSDDVLPIEPGGVILVAATYMDALPRDAAEHYTYAAVFESNGDPSDDWEYQGDFDWDLYQGTDRWYEIHWDPVSGAWTMTVSDTLTPHGPSGARALLFGDTILWVIPAAEFESDTPAYRVTSFVHDGTFAPEVSGGDVSGTDPTELPIPVIDLDG